MKNFRDELNKIWEEKDYDNNSFFEAICELHESFYERLKQEKKEIDRNVLIEALEEYDEVKWKYTKLTYEDYVNKYHTVKK